MQPHQHIDVEGVVVLHGGKVRSPQLLAKYFGSQGFNDLDCRLNLCQCFRKIAPLPLNESNVSKRGRFRRHDLRLRA